MAIKGAVLGDILGSQYEFNRPKNLDWQNIPLIIDDKAKFTDDSVMMLAIKKALVEDNDLVETMVDVGQQYPFCGYGAKFFSWINGKKHQPYNSRRFLHPATKEKKQDLVCTYRTDIVVDTPGV